MPVPPPAPEIEEREATLENGFLTVRVELPTGADGPRPAVITHSNLADHTPLRTAGLVVVTYRINWEILKGLAPKPPEPTPAPGGRTVGVWLLASPTPKTVGQGYFGLIEATAGMVPKVVDYLARLPGVDPTRIAIVGSSTSGFVALEATAREPRLAAAVAIAACGDYHRFLHLSSLAMNGEPLDLAPAYDRQLRAHQPVQHPERLTHAALLMVNGTDDTAVPLVCARETARVFEGAYARAGVPERFRAVVVEHAGHNDLETRAREETLAWLQRWLVDAGRPGTAGAPGDAGSRVLCCDRCRPPARPPRS